MERYENKEIKWLINKPGGLFLTRRSERRFAGQWSLYCDDKRYCEKIDCGINPSSCFHLIF